MITIPNSGPTKPAGRRTSRPVPPPINDHRPIYKRKRRKWFKSHDWEWFAFYLSLYICVVLIVTTIGLWPRTYDYHYLNNTTLRTHLHTNITEFQWGSAWKRIVTEPPPLDPAVIGRRIKFKFRGVYDDLSDAELGRRVIAKYSTAEIQELIKLSPAK